MSWITSTTRRVVAPFLETLAKETNGTAVFGLVHGDHVLVVGKNEGNQNIGFGLRLGHRFHMTLGAHGKAIVAFMNEAERERVLAKKKLYFYGEASRMDMKRLDEEMSKMQRPGFCPGYRRSDSRESTIISAPVFGIREKILGCVILIGTFPADKIEQYGPKVASTSRQISHRLGAAHRTPYSM